jgi:hypothetical protein
MVGMVSRDVAASNHPGEAGLIEGEPFDVHL